MYLVLGGGKPNTHVQSSIIHNNQEVHPKSPSTDERMNRIHSGVVFVHKNEGNSDSRYNTDET